jgi:hypothetical protein
VLLLAIPWVHTSFLARHGVSFVVDWYGSRSIQRRKRESQIGHLVTRPAWRYFFEKVAQPRVPRHLPHQLVHSRSRGGSKLHALNASFNNDFVKAARARCVLNGRVHIQSIEPPENLTLTSFYIFVLRLCQPFVA